MRYIFVVAFGILAGCADYPIDGGYGDDSSYWQLRELRREQQQAASDAWLDRAFEQNQLNQIQMDQGRFNHYGFSQ